MSSPPALVLVTTSYPSRADGSEAAGAFVADLVRELALTMPVRVVAPGTGDARETHGPNVEVFRFAAPAKPLSNLRPWNPLEAWQIFGVLRAGMSATQAAVDAGPTAHVLALWALPSGYWARRVAQSRKLGYSVWTLGSDIWSLGRVPLLRRLLRTVLQDAAHCYSDGLKLAEDTRAIGGRPVRFLPSTRRIDRIRTANVRDEPPYRLLFLGRWHPNKGVDLLLQALARLDDADWRRIGEVDICGGGPLEPLVRKGVEDLRSQGRPVTLQGYLDKEAAELAISRADYLLIPSRIESIPVVFSDAMKLDCPVVAMPVGDLAQLVDASPACGVVAAEVSVEAYVRALRSALARPASAFAAGVRERAQRFALSAIAGTLRDDASTEPSAVPVPRWGNSHRDRKAEAIWQTLAHFEGAGIGNGTWLDIGCGSGGIAGALAARASTVTGIDPEPWPSWGELESAATNLTFRVERFDEATLPVAPGSIDVIVCNQVYEHVADPVRLIANIGQALRPGGVCYFAGPNLLWPVEPHVFWPFVHWLPRRAAQALMRVFGSRQADQLDAYSAHYWRLEQWFHQAGLEPRPAIAARLASELAVRGWRMRLPRWGAALIDGAAPISPGFVWILRKP